MLMEEMTGNVKHASPAWHTVRLHIATEELKVR